MEKNSKNLILILIIAIIVIILIITTFYLQIGGSNLLGSAANPGSIWSSPTF
jgi:flagellar basal body-associated protein FliL